MDARRPVDAEADVDAGLYSDADGDGPLHDPALYASRELAQLDFNTRVLAQALDPKVPLLERLRFLCISSTNLDEFFEIRVGNLLRAQRSEERRVGKECSIANDSYLSQ